MRSVWIMCTMLIFASWMSVQSSDQRPTAISVTAFNINFRGDWAGQLEYRDFQTNASTVLPTWITMTPNADGTSVIIDYVYDDGPGKTVRERSSLSFSGDTAFVVSGGSRETYSVEGVESFRKSGLGTLVLTGSGKDNGKPVAVRITLQLRRNLFTYRKETKAAGAEYAVRDTYTMTRLTVPTS